jgi:hypothetical protein
MDWLKERLRGELIYSEVLVKNFGNIVVIDSRSMVIQMYQHLVFYNYKRKANHYK